jgi:sporulation protein YlmC with PRC-barrel domain
MADNTHPRSEKMKHLGSVTALSLLLASGIAAGSALAADTSTQTKQMGATPPNAMATTPSNAMATARSSEMMATLPGEALPISDFYNQNVYDNRNNKIGNVNDLLLDAGGKVNAVIVGVGGFLGVGEKNVAVPFQAVKVTEKDGKRYLVLDTTKEALESAPGYTFDHSKNVWIPATKQG